MQTAYSSHWICKNGTHPYFEKKVSSILKRKDFAKAILQLPLISEGAKLQKCVSIHTEGTSVIQTTLIQYRNVLISALLTPMKIWLTKQHWKHCNKRVGLFSRKFYGKLQIRFSTPPTMLQDILPQACGRLIHISSQYMNSLFLNWPQWKKAGILLLDCFFSLQRCFTHL